MSVTNKTKEHLVDGKYSFQDLIDIEQLREMFEGFAQATGFTTGLVSYPEQELLIGTGWRDICTKFHRAFPASEIHCKQSNLDLTSHLKERKALNVRHCESGLVDGATPIIIKGAHVANLFTGQILFAKPDAERFRKQGEEYGYDVDAYLEALEEVPVVTEEAFKKALEFLSEMAVILANQGLKEFENREKTHALQDSESRLREAQQMAHLGHWFWDVKTGDVEWSKEVYKIFRLDPKEFKPQIDSILSLSPWPEDHQRDKELIQKAIESREIGSYEQRFLRPDNSTGYYFSTFQGIYDDEGNLTAIRGTVQDITERKLAGNALIESQEQFDMIESNINDAIWLFDFSNQKTSFCTSSVERITGFTADEITSLTLDKLYPPKSLEIIMNYIAEGLEEAETKKDVARHVELQAYHKDGSLFWIEISARLLRDENGAPKEILGVSRDITHRKQAQEALRVSEERLKIAGKTSYDLIYEWDVASDSLEWFGDVDGLLGYEQGKISRDIGAWLALIHPEDSVKLSNAVEEHKTSTNPIQYEYRIERGDGTYRYWKDQGLPICDASGRPYKWIGACTDITDRKEAEQALQQRLAYEQCAAECIGILAEAGNLDSRLARILDSARKVVEADRAYIFANEDDEQAGICMSQLHESCVEGIEPQIDNPELRHLPYEIGAPTLLRNLQERRPFAHVVAEMMGPEREILESQQIVSILIVPVYTKDHLWGFIGFDDCEVSRHWQDDDIHILQTIADAVGVSVDRWQAEEALRSSEEQLALALDASNDGIWDWDMQTGHAYFSP